MTVQFLKRLAGIAGCAALAAAGPAQAQLKVEIAGVGANQIPIAIAGFAGEAAPNAVTDIVKADLARSGAFRIIDTGSQIAESAPVNYGEWKGRGADALAAGSVVRAGNGFEVRYKLFDTVRGAEVSTLAQSVPASATRLAAHKIADDIYQKLTGTRGMFSTRIAYVVKAGREYRIEVADADGGDIQMALRSKEPIISPAWSPDGTKVAYVSFEDKKPVIYVQNLVTGQRSVISNQRGNNSAPAWSPDGARLAVSLSRTGNTQIFIVNADGSGLRRLTTSGGGVIDTEPQWSADGQSIYFMSDRSGGAQIYRMSAAGGPAQRLTFKGARNESPRISPDGKYLAYVGQREGRFQVHVLDLASGQEQRVSDGPDDQSPSFAANSRYVMYANRARGTLGVVSVDGRAKFTITMPGGDIREPTWGPFM